MSDAGLHVVFGATGRLGDAVVRELVAQGKPTRAIARSGKADLPDGVEVVAADATQHDSVVPACAGASVVYHCANAPYTDWPAMFAPIMHGIIDGAASAHAKLVFGDNLYMYGPVDVPLTEDLPHDATDPKGRARAAAAESLMDAHVAGKVRATIGRGSDFFGPGITMSHMGGRVFPPALAGKPASVLGNVDVPHTYTYIGDFAKALVTLGARDEALGEAWHVPSAGTVTTREFLTMVFEEAGTAPRIRAASRTVVSLMALFDPIMRELKDILYQLERPFVVDHGKFERAFGASPTPHREAIRKTLDWFRAHPGAG